ncbi:MAG: GNAT family N-acetyltransferase [Thermoleophilia bacterium]|nr:GNAT family N-acetyltransferase [Thermoleophilia bacterium]
MLELREFNESDFDQLIAAMPNSRAHLLWAGPEYTYPLTAGQLKETLSKTTGETPSFKVYKAVLSDAERVVGHVQLMDIDRTESRCVLGKVLIFPAHRGRGFGRSLVRAAVEEAFAVLGLREMTLLVFDFNKAAIVTYESVGFVSAPPHPGVLPFEDETWQAIRMALTSERRSEHSRRGSQHLRRPRI